MSRIKSMRWLLMGALLWSTLGLALAEPAAACKQLDGSPSSSAKHDCRRTPIPSGQDEQGTLTEADIPTGTGGFFRDYEVQLQDGDSVAIDLVSNEFDPIVSLIKPDGTPMGDNDDSPEGSTNSLLFVRIKESGAYIVRVSSFGETGGGAFTLTVTRLAPID